MDQSLEKVRQLAAKNTAMLRDSRAADAAVVNGAKKELTKIIKDLGGFTEGGAITDPVQSDAYLGLVHRKASLERLIAQSDSDAARSRDGTMQA